MLKTLYQKSKTTDVRVPVSWLIGVIGAGLLVWLIMIPPVLGVADNGDFSRVTGLTGFQPLNPQEPYALHYFGYAHQYFGYGFSLSGGYVTTQLFLLLAVGAIARVFNSEFFDIRWLGAVYGILYLAAVVLLVRHVPLPKGANRAQAAFLASALGALLLFVFGDVGYAAYFQSFFGEPYAMTAMLLLAASAMVLFSTERPSLSMYLLFVIAAFAVATSKIQNAPLGLLFAVLAWRMLRLRADRRWHRKVLTGIVALVVASSAMLVGVPNQLKHINLYQSIFFGVLKDSPNVERDLKELGIPPKYAGLAGTNYFQKDTVIPQSDPTLQREVLDRLSHKDIAFYYVRHPERFVEKLKKVAKQAAYIRPYYLGNYDRSSDKPRGAVSFAYSAWSEWKARTMPHTLGFFLGFYVLYYAGLVIGWRRAETVRGKLVAETFAAIGLTGAFAAVIPIIGDGEADLAKHLFMFDVSFDMMVISAATSICYVLAEWTSRLGARSQQEQLRA